MRRRLLLLGSCALLFFLSWQLFMRNLDAPQSLFWDETYHVTSAYKYLHGRFFMEPHPPLGKLIIALGEKLIGSNDIDRYAAIAEGDRLDQLPDEFSLRGLRFLPAFFGCCSILLVFLIALLLLDSIPIAMAFGVFALSDTAFLLHSRAAMLDSLQIFFLLSTIALSIKSLIADRPVRAPWYLFGGVLSGFALSVKLSSLPVLVFGLAVVLREARSGYRSGDGWFRGLLKNSFAYLGSCLFAFMAIWYLHFALVNETAPSRWYGVDNGVREIVRRGEAGRLSSFPQLFRTSLRYSFEYHKGVPALSPCNPEENGSLPWRWLGGGRTIPYWWQREGLETRYLYLVPNPAVWILSLCGVLASVIYFGARLFFQLPRANNQEGAGGVLLTLYLAMMLGFLMLDRVMYLYHYLFPMLLGLLLSAGILRVLLLQTSAVGRRLLSICLAVWVILAVGGLYEFSPLVFGQPLSYEQFQRRAWAPWWELRDVD